MRRILKSLKTCLGVLLGITAAASMHAATATFQNGVNGYTGTVDTHVRNNAVNTSEANNTIVLTDGENPISHGMIRFDNIFGLGPGQVPPDATITAAYLVFRTANNGNTVNFHRMLVPWEETNTWNVMVNGLSADDVEMASAIEFSTVDQAPVGTVSTNDVTAIVQGWLAGTFPNYGWGTLPTSTDGWQIDSSEAGTVANRPMLIVVFEAMPRPIVIVQQPTGGTVNEGGTFTFSVIVSGTDPMYQWRKDGVNIDGATSATYTIPRVLRTDEGTYTVVVQNSITAPITSSGAFLDVIPDLQAPTVVCAYGTNNDNVTLYVVFSESVLNAANAANYSVIPTGGGDPLSVTNAVYGGASQTEGNVVVLTLDGTTPWVAPGAYSLIVGDAITDLFGNAIASGSIVPIGLYVDTLFTISESQIWTFNDTGENIGDTWKERVYNDAGWKSGPALIGFETAAIPEPLRTPANVNGTSGTQVRTYYFRTHFNYSGPAGNGTLRFRTIVDDAVAIYLNGVEIHRMRLPAGPLNYLTEGIGGAVGDGNYEGPFTVCVTNLLVGDNVIAAEVHQTGATSSDMLWGMDLAAVIPQITPVSIVTQPTGTNVLEGSSFTLRVVAAGSSPRYQWQHNGMNIPDATNATYTVSVANCDTDGGTYRVIVANDAPSTVTSSTVTVNVTCDTFPPVVACVYGTNDAIVVVFNEVTTNGTEFFNFIVEPAAGGAQVAISTNYYTTGADTGTTVILVLDPTTPLTPDQPYNLTVQGIADLFGNVMPQPVTLPIPLFTSTSLLPLSGSQWRYETSGTDLSNTWYAVNYNDGAWPLGTAVFDAKRPQRTTIANYPVSTQTTLSNAAGTAQIPTHYFRTQFGYSGSATATLQLDALLDDGAVYYLNGREIFRVGLTAAPAVITYNTLANRTVGDATNEFFYVCVTNLVNGNNVLAVELHNQSLTSSDLTFATGINIYSATPPSRLSISPPVSGQITISWSGTGVLQRRNSLSTGTWQDVPNVTGNSYTTSATGTGFFRLR